VRIFQNVKNWLIKHLPVEADIALHENSSFHKWVGYPLLLIFTLIIFITFDLYQKGIYSLNKDLLITTKTLSDFVKFYAFPITALTVPLSLVVMFNRFHSSKQKAKSNRLIEQNNLVNNYFSHFSNFNSYTGTLEVKYKSVGLKLSAQRLYRILFQNCNLMKFDATVQKDCIDIIIHSAFVELEKYRNHIVINSHYTVDKEVIEGVELLWSTRKDSQIYKYLEELKLIIIDLINFQGIINSKEIEKYFYTEYEKSWKKTL
jgi:hypothetical protein